MLTVATSHHPDAAHEETGLLHQPGQITFGMEVIAEDGRVGNIRRMLPEWRADEPTHLVLHMEGGTGPHVIVPLRWAIRVTPERVVLRARRRHLTRMLQLRPDDDLAAEIRQALAASPALRSPRDLHAVKVAVCDGVAFLSGYVRTLLRAVDADLLAHQIPGIVEVRNDLIIDDDLKQAVVNALRRDPHLHIVDLSVEAELGTIRIRGRAASPEQCALALLTARRVEGVSRVVCAFDVEPPEIEVQVAPAISQRQFQLQWSRPAAA